MKIFLVLLLIQFGLLSNAQNSTSLVQVLIMFGNVPRAPSFVYPNDPYDANYWKKYGGLGQVTEKGLKGSYQLGQSIKNYYSAFLSPVFNFSKVYARSADVDSSIMATNTFLSGLFPPSSGNFLWSPTVSWYPVPVHTAHTSQDNIFYPSCSRLDDFNFKKLHSNDFKNVEKEKLNFTRLMSELSGLVNMSYIDMNKILESNLAKLENNLPLQEWVTDYFVNLTQANDYGLNYRYGTFEQARLVSGGLINSIKNEMLNKINRNSSNEINIYSCLDSHLTAMKRLLSLETNLTQPNYLSALVFELRMNSNRSYFVQIKHKNSSHSEPIVLKPIQINGCDLLCPWEKFIQLIINATIPNLPEICGIKSNVTAAGASFKSDYDLSALDSLTNNSTYNRSRITLFDLGLIIAVFVLTILTLILSILLILTCIQMRHCLNTRV